MSSLLPLYSINFFLLHLINLKNVNMVNEILNYKYAPTQYIEVDDIKYAYRSLGKSSGVPILCLQHFTGTLDNWDPTIINGLAQERQVVTIDNAGVGNSEGEVPDNVLEMSRHAIKIIEAFGISKCDLLGYSLGGFISQTMADFRPDLLRKIVLVGTAPQGAKALHSFHQLTAKAFALEPTEGFLYIFATTSESSRNKLKAAQGRLLERTVDRDKPATIPAIQAQIKALTRWGTDPTTIDLTKITQPVLVVQGSNDIMMDSDASFELYKQITNSMLIYYPDSAHGSLFQYPELFVDQVNSFLNRFE
jgi:pimeloyl-ACP methyl ester carboxylesterase